MKKTKILCTAGPATQSPEILQRMVDAGMNALRLNTSHGDFSEYHRMIEQLSCLGNYPVVMDTQGPKIRLRMKEAIEVAHESRVKVGFHPGNDFYLDADVFDYVNVGDRALIDDGTFEAYIMEKTSRYVVFEFCNEGTLFSGKAVNFPKKALPLATLTDKDHKTLEFAQEHEIDYIALSFTRGKHDIDACREKLGSSRVKIIAKIENQQGVDHIQEIIDNVDGVMIARGDMGVELEPEEIPILQKRLIHLCNQAGVLVITATQMLQSMINNPRPTRAETSDVANAILDGSDVVMLSGETAVGQYPVESVRMMSRIARYAEKHVRFQDPPAVDRGTERAICDSIKSLCDMAGVNKIVSVTRRGRTAKMISRLRLQQEILALTSKEETFRELHLYYGIKPVMFPRMKGSVPTISAGMYLHKQGYIDEEDLVLFASGEYQPSDYNTNTIQILPMKDMLDYCRTHEGVCELP